MFSERDNITPEMTSDTPPVFPNIKTPLQLEWEEIFDEFDEDFNDNKNSSEIKSFIVGVEKPPTD